MACLKCGKETGESSVFCTACLDAMKDYPVKPGTAIQLPHHPDTPVERKKVRRQLSQNEELHRLRSQNRWLGGIAVMMGLAAIALAMLLLVT